MNEHELMQKLALSKAIMDKSDTIKKGSLPPTSLQEFNTPESKYNIPADILQETESHQPYLSSVPNTKSVGVPTVDAIKKSKLPDEIKKLMIEHPISQPQQMTGPTLSDELVEKATRLMGKNTENHISQKSKDITSGIKENTKLDMSQIKKMIEEAVNSALRENGLLVESTEKSNEQFTFKVGKHVFEGKVTKIKKLS